MRGLSIGLLPVLLTSAALAAPIKVDFGNATGPSPLETGFTAFNVTDAGSGTSNPSQSFGPVTLQFFSPNARGRDRSNPTPLLRDLVSNLGRQLLNNNGTLNNTSTTASTPTLRLSGLDPSTPYEIRVWSQDNSFNNGDITRWFSNFTYTTQVGSAVTNVTGLTSSSITSINDFSTLFTITSSPAGVIDLFQQIQDATANDGNSGQINAISITAIPEPSAIVAIVLGGAMLLRRR
jgi:hypothetical protein